MLVLVCRVLQPTESRLLLVDLYLILMRGNAAVLNLLLLEGRITVLMIILVHGIARGIICNSPTIMTALSHHQILVVNLNPVLRVGLRTIHLVM